MPDFQAIFDELKTDINHLRDRYIVQYLPAKPEHTPEVYEYDVKSFSLLSHAFFEEYVESVSLTILKEIEADFLAKKLSLSTAALILAYGEKINFPENESDPLETCFDLVRSAIELGKRRHSTVLYENHGFALKYLRRVLVPVGINPPLSVGKGESLARLANARGSFAHSRARSAVYEDARRAKKPLAPEDAWLLVADCLDICEGIKDAALARW